jgi:predicted nucleic-acid-binding protein
VIAIDTNVLVRFLTADDAAQYAAAAGLIHGSSSRSLFVSDVVLCELAWVLDAVYQLGPEEIARGLRGMRATEQFAFEDPDRIDRALTAFESGRGDFADYVIRERGLAAGCAEVATFDRVLQKEPGFRAP